MLDQVPFGVDLLFILTTLFTLGIFIASIMTGLTEKVRGRAHPVALVLLMWMIFQSTLALNRWYMDREAMPPNLFFPIWVALLVTLIMFAFPGGRRFVDGLNPQALVLLHIVRIPAEITLYLLATWKQVPWSMTFYGVNYDILSGLTAPLIWWFGYRRRLIPDRWLLVWNIAALMLLLTVVIRGAGAAPTVLQAWDFEQPNYAVSHFPYVWLPSIVVPLVFFSHLTLIRRLVVSGSKRKISRNRA
jgi:hypothetical protein